MPLPEILRLGIAQYSARLVELLEPKGWRIENRVLHSDGQVRSWFRLLPPQPAQRELDLRRKPARTPTGCVPGGSEKSLWE